MIFCKHCKQFSLCSSAWSQWESENSWKESCATRFCISCFAASTQQINAQQESSDHAFSLKSLSAMTYQHSKNCKNIPSLISSRFSSNSPFSYDFQLQTLLRPLNRMLHLIVQATQCLAGLLTLKKPNQSMNQPFSK